MQGFTYSLAIICKKITAAATVVDLSESVSSPPSEVGLITGQRHSYVSGVSSRITFCTLCFFTNKLSATNTVEHITVSLTD